MCVRFIELFIHFFFFFFLHWMQPNVIVDAIVYWSWTSSEIKAKPIILIYGVKLEITSHIRLLNE